MQNENSNPQQNNDIETKKQVKAGKKLEKINMGKVSKLYYEKNKVLKEFKPLVLGVAKDFLEFSKELGISNRSARRFLYYHTHLSKYLYACLKGKHRFNLDGSIPDNDNKIIKQEAKDYAKKILDEIKAKKIEKQKLAKSKKNFSKTNFVKKEFKNKKNKTENQVNNNKKPFYKNKRKENSK